MTSKTGSDFGFYFAAAFLITAFCGWATHIWWAISTVLGDVPMTINQGVIAVLGAIIPPVGMLHGIYLWF